MASDAQAFVSDQITSEDVHLTNAGIDQKITRCAAREIIKMKNPQILPNNNLYRVCKSN